MSEPKIDSQRLWDGHMEMAKIGPSPGGGTARLSLTDFDREARDLFRRWCRESKSGSRLTTNGMQIK